MAAMLTCWTGAALTVLANIMRGDDDWRFPDWHNRKWILEVWWWSWSLWCFVIQFEAEGGKNINIDLRWLKTSLNCIFAPASIIGPVVLWTLKPAPAPALSLQTANQETGRVGSSHWLFQYLLASYYRWVLTGRRCWVNKSDTFHPDSPQIKSSVV